MLKLLNRLLDRVPPVLRPPLTLAFFFGTFCFVQKWVILAGSGYTLMNEVSAAETRLQEVQDENRCLNEELQKLNDPDYILEYAREHYMMTKQGEQIFVLPERKE